MLISDKMSDKTNTALLPKLPRGLLRASGEARDIFLKYGLPQKRSPCAESWKYTPLNELANRRLYLPIGLPALDDPNTAALAAFASSDAGSAQEASLLAEIFANSSSASICARLPHFSDNRILLFIDGSLQQSDRLFRDSLLTAYAGLATIDALQPMAALNLASRCESWKLMLSGEEPMLHIISLASSDSRNGKDASASTDLLLLQTRLRIEVAAGSRATIFHSSLQGVDNCCANDFFEIDVGDGASLEHIVLHGSAASSFNFTRSVVRLGISARYRHVSALRGGGLTRQGILVSLSGEGSSCALHGGYRPSGSGHIDNSTEIIHAQPGCVSDALYKGAIGDSCVGVFHGKIYVAKDAQSTEGYQMSRALLLSNKARAYHKPELEIYADDVKCSHGATVGALDEEQMFYLRSRGLSADSCEQLLMEAFLCEALTCERDDSAAALREHILS